MPSPVEIRDSFLKYLRKGMPHGKFWIDEGQCYPAHEVRLTIKAMALKDPELHKILDVYITTRMARAKIAERVAFDSSTVKRHLDTAIDLVLQNLKLNNRDTSDLITDADRQKYRETLALGTSPKTIVTVEVEAS